MKVKIIYFLPYFMVFTMVSGEKILTHEESIQRHKSVLSSKFLWSPYKGPPILSVVGF